MAKKLDKDISGSVQEKRGMLYLVVSYKDPVTQKHKVKWVGMGYCFLCQRNAQRVVNAV